MTTRLAEVGRTRPEFISVEDKVLKIRPHPGQAPIITAQHPTVAAIAGSGGGKTIIGLVKASIYLQHLGGPGIVVEPTERMLDRNILQAAPGRPSFLGLLKYIDRGVRYLRQDRAIYTKYGPIYLFSATNPEGMEGLHAAWALLDEAGQMSKLVFETARRRVSFREGPLLLTTTPYNRGWLYRDVYLPWKAGDSSILVSQFSSLANPNFSKDIYDQRKREMDPARFRMFYEGGFERPEGMIYSQWEDSMLVDPFEIPEEWDRLGGLDYGFNHPTAAVFLARSNDGVYYLHDEYRQAGKLMEKNYHAMEALCASKVPIWYDDPAGAQNSAEMRRLGLPVRAAENEVQAGIDTLGTLMAQGRFKVFRTCPLWQEEVEGYVWDRDAGDNFTEKPLKQDDDLMDATRYAVHSAEKSPKIQLFV